MIYYLMYIMYIGKEHPPNHTRKVDTHGAIWVQLSNPLSTQREKKRSKTLSSVAARVCSLGPSI